jgi:signal transduction histidine kinase
MSIQGQQTSIVERILAGGGEMGVLIRAFDWSKTPLGPVETWPQSLRSAVSILLPSKAQICLFWGKEFTVLYNDAYCPTLADKHPRVLGIPGRECWSEVWDVLGVLFEQVISTGEAFWAKEYQFLLHRRGFIEETYYDISYDPVRDETGGVGGIFCIVSDMTGRVLGERRLRTLRELSARVSEGKTAEEACTIAVQTLADNPSDVPFALIYLLDKHGQKAALAGSIGVEPDKPVTPLEIELAIADSEITWPLTEAYDTGESLTVSDLPVRFSETPPGIWPDPPHTALVLPIKSGGRCIGFLIVGVSPRLLLDEQYEGFFGLVAGHLEKAIDYARAYEIERERADALAEIDRAKTAFFNNISHEFRTPLTLMLEPLNDLLGDDLTGEQHEMLKLVQRNSLRLLKLVNTLLDFSRIEAGRADISFEPTNLASYTADLASVFRSAVEKAGLRLLVNCPTLPEEIYVDREMWEKIVLNLLSNAFKFTFEGEIEVGLRALDDHVELIVRDTGVGIAPDELPQIFQRFHRVRGARSRTHEGTGIGLALVQDLVQLHQGNIEVQSEVNRGTTFTVFIPRGVAHLPPKQVEAERTRASTARGAAPYVEEALRWLPDAPRMDNDGLQSVVLQSNAVAAFDTAGARVMLVDDNSDMRDYLHRLLAAHYHVEAFGDGLSALIAVEKHPPDLVLADVMMPGMDGFELLRTIRTAPATSALPVILLSARAGEEATIEGLKAGADDYLTKPFSARELLARISAQLEMARLRQQIADREQQMRVQAQAEQQRVTGILESISDAFATLDKEYRYTYLNSKGEEVARNLSGKSKENLIGKIAWDAFPGLEESPIGQAIHRAMAEKVSAHVDAFFPPLNAWFEVHVYPSDEGLSIYFEDITARKETETQIRQQTSDLAVLEERQRISRELHDAVNQLLFSASVVAESLPRLWEREPEKVLPQLTRLGRLTRGAMAEMRTLLLELRPAALENSQLAELIDHLVDIIRGRTSLDVSLTLEDNDALTFPFDVRLAFYRIAQEALNNVVKHANAEKVEVYLRQESGFAELRIRDNGRGFKLATPSVGIGLHSMSERAQNVGAFFQVNSELGHGTEVLVRWTTPPA